MGGAGGEKSPPSSSEVEERRVSEMGTREGAGEGAERSGGERKRPAPRRRVPALMRVRRTRVTQARRVPDGATQKRKKAKRKQRPKRSQTPVWQPSKVARRRPRGTQPDVHVDSGGRAEAENPYCSQEKRKRTRKWEARRRRGSTGAMAGR